MSDDSLMPDANADADSRDSPFSESNAPSTPSSASGSASDSASEFSFTLDIPAAPPSPPPEVFDLPNHANFANKGLQRSIALVLKQVGFDSATPATLHAFTQHAEVFLEHLIRDVQTLAIGARRTYPTPRDFELVFKARKLPINHLKPHRKHPIPRNLLQPKIETADHMTPESILTSLPILHHDLSGAEKRATMPYIPATFPEFPSVHTFRYTLRVEKTERDPQKIRAAAAKAAEQGEDALCGLVRAAKVRKQKEVRSIVQRDPYGAERYRLWESAMQALLSERVEGGTRDDPVGKARLSDQEIADASMIVNASAPYMRQEIPKSGAGKKPLPRTGLEIQGR